MRLYWSSRSPFVRTVMITAHETGHADRLELVRVEVGLARLNAEVMGANPLNRIPTLQTDEGDILFESRNICDFLDRTSGSASLYLGGRERDRVLTWQAVGLGICDVAMLWNNERNRPEALRSAPHQDAYAAKIEASLDWLEARAPALVATRFNLGGIAIGAALCYLDFRFDALAWRSSRPQLAAWLEQLSARPSMRQTVYVDVF